jgi:hypothetical protein
MGAVRKESGEVSQRSTSIDRVAALLSVYRHDDGSTTLDRDVLAKIAGNIGDN